MNLKDEIKFLKGVGPTRAETLNKLNIKTVEDLLYFFPRRYEDRRNIISISKVLPGNFHTIKGAVIRTNLLRLKGAKSIFKALVSDTSGVLEGVWFNQPYLASMITQDSSIIFFGKVQYSNQTKTGSRYSKGALQIVSPEYEILQPDEQDKSLHMDRIIPIYPLTKSLYQKFMRRIVNQALNTYSSLLKSIDILPKDIKIRYKLTELNLAIKNVHFPSSFEALTYSTRRLVFDEFFMLQVGLMKIKGENFTHGSISNRSIKGSLIEDFKQSIPFKLTGSQKKVITEIEEDIKRQVPMNRLLQGDVGSGKTIVATHAIVLAVQNRQQTAFMAPTEILAQQHYMKLSHLLMPLGINVVLLISEMAEYDKKIVYDQIKDGSANLVVGTHALLQETVCFKNLSLVVIDEQHKFGVLQRAVLKDKGLNPDMLIMTATPIPRTLALTVYGDLDISTINEIPAGRGSIKTYWIGEDKRIRLNNFVKNEIKQGRQAYVIYPVIHKSKRLHIKSAVSMYNLFKEKVFSEYNVGLLHGAMTNAEKTKVMENFRNRKIDILVSTVVIEVGIDIPNASVMIVEHADRFGLSQLHQLRGRIGRGPHESYCILISNVFTPQARKRLETMTQTLDGFKISQEDMLLRGTGEFFGTRQHGLPEIRIGDVIKDIKIMQIARLEAKNLIDKDPQLILPEHTNILQALKDRFPQSLELARVG